MRQAIARLAREGPSRHRTPGAQSPQPAPSPAPALLGVRGRRTVSLRRLSSSSAGAGEQGLAG
eukprot:12086770-Alexandrium_andersonii.AAC.1